MLRLARRLPSLLAPPSPPHRLPRSLCTQGADALEEALLSRHAQYSWREHHVHAVAITRGDDSRCSQPGAWERVGWDR